MDQEAAPTRTGAAQMDVLTNDFAFKMACEDFLDYNRMGGKRAARAFDLSEDA